MVRNLHRMVLFLTLFIVACLVGSAASGQDGKPLDRQYQKCAEWLARGAKPTSATQRADARTFKQVQLIAHPGTCRDGLEMVLGAGVAFREGMVRDVAELEIRDAAVVLPSVFAKRTVYPDGSLQWVWADFVGRAGKEYAVAIRDPVPASQQPGVRVDAGGEQVTIDNGALELRWNKSFATPTLVLLVADGKKTLVGRGDGRGFYFVSSDSQQYVLGGKHSELDFRVESCNSLRAVLRVEGWYVSEKGEKSGRALVRYDVAWRQPWIRVSHRFIVTDDNDKITYREIGARFPFTAGGPVTARFGVSGQQSLATALAHPAAEAWLMQEKYPLYHKKEKKCTAGLGDKAIASGDEAEGWVDLSGETAGAVMAVKDFAPQFPKELAARADGLCAKLWSGRTGLVLDYRPETLAKDWWGEWLDRIEYSREWGNQRRMDGGGKPTEKIGRRPVTPEIVKKLNPSCVGTARTHSLLIGWYLGGYDESRTRSWAACLNDPPVVQPDPQWLAHMDRRVMMPTLARGEFGREYETIEKGISAFFDCLLYPRDAFPYTGWYEWGKHPDLAYEKLRDGRIFAQWYRLPNLNYYYYNWNLAHTWMRTGDRKFLRELERFNRFLADNHLIHWDGGKDGKKRGFLPSEEYFYAPLYWASHKNSFGDNSTEPISGMVYEYFLRDNRDYLDVFANMSAALGEAFHNEYYETADMTLAMMCALYRVTQDPAMLERCRSYFRAMTDPTSETGLRASFWKTEWNQVYKSHRKIFNFLQYYDLTADPSAPPVIVKLQRKCIARYQAEATQPFEYQNRMGANFGRIYQWTGDEDCLYWVRHEVLAAREILDRFFALPPEERAAQGFFKSRPAGTSFNFYLFDGVSFQTQGKFVGKGMLSINGSTLPSVISFPMALRAMKGFPGD